LPSRETSTENVLQAQREQEELLKEQQRLVAEMALKQKTFALVYLSMQSMNEQLCAEKKAEGEKKQEEIERTANEAAVKSEQQERENNNASPINRDTTNSPMTI